MILLPTSTLNLIMELKFCLFASIQKQIDEALFYETETIGIVQK